MNRLRGLGRLAVLGALTICALALIAPALTAQINGSTQAQSGGQCLAPQSGLVSWWPADGDANDIVSGINGTLENGVTFETGEVGDAFLFNRASDQFVSTSDAPALGFERTNAFSLEAWVRTSETVHDIFIAAKQPNSAPFDGYGLAITNGEAPACDATNPAAAGAGQLLAFVDGAVSNTCPPDFNVQVRGTAHINDGKWHHVAMTYDGSSTAAGVKLYVDGAEDTEAIQGDTLGTHSVLNTAAFTIGSRSSGVPFNGDVDELQVFNRALSAAEIQATFNAASAGTCKPANLCTAPPSGLISWWPGEGNANDIVGGNNGTLQGGAAFAAGEVGQAFSFATSGDVDVPDSASLDPPSGQITVDAWVNPAAQSAGGSILNKRPVANTTGYTLEQQFAADGTVLWNVFVGGTAVSVFSNTHLPLNTWTFVAGTYDGATAKLYFNGTEVGSVAHSGSIDASTGGDLEIGHNIVNGAFFDGLIDEVEVFNRALSMSELQALYLAGNAGKCAPATATPTATATATSTATATATATASATRTATPTATFTPMGGGRIKVSPGHLNLGEVTFSATKKKHFKISNTLKNSMLIGDVAQPTGPGHAQFTISGTTSFSLPRGGKGDVITVQYTPSAPGATDTAMIVVTSSDPNHHTTNVPLTGKGKKSKKK